VSAVTLFAALARGGVRDVVVSPGSRSTPLVDGAAAVPGLRLHDLLDERAAAFFALGQARATGRPSVLVCTSGTAPAHYFPAILEASLAGVPLIAVSADRPEELQACGASQTVDQLHLFGRHVRLFLELGDLSHAASLGRVAAQAIAAAQAGPVHLNVRARKPLEPAGLPVAVPEVHTPRVHQALAAPPAAALAELAAACRRARRGVIACGPAGLPRRDAREAVIALARATGFPIVADPASQLRVAGAHAADLLLGSPRLRRALAPDLVLQLGAPLVTAGWERWLAETSPARAVIEPGLPGVWSDPDGTASMVVSADVGLTAAGLAATLGAPVEVNDWAERFAVESARLRGLVEERLADDTLSELGAARDAIDALPPDALLVLGNSLPIRLADVAAPAIEPGVLSQRGASGIDGLVAGAAGAAGASGRPTLLLLGDVSLLHDVGGLLAASQSRTPLVLVVLNNDGGRLFEQLPIARVPGADGVMTHFTTPHGLGFRAAAELYGLRYACPPFRRALRQTVAKALLHPGATLVEVRLPPHGAREDLAALRALVEAA
jgi:2-succinyl-5-enolpyruvyl-6-hydroxy-3-cyclohexene-1-carboxylate synthase